MININNSQIKGSSIFLKKQGGTPLNKMLDFLIIHQEFDYSLKDIAEHSGVGYSTLKKMKKKLIQNGWIIYTRNVGIAKMYKLNRNNSMVVAFIPFYRAVVDAEVEKIVNPKQKMSNSKKIVITADAE